MAIRSQCGICLEKHTLSAFRFAPCGHGYCETCTATYVAVNRDELPRRKNLKVSCPTCRIPFDVTKLHGIFLSCTEDDGNEPPSSQPRYSPAVIKQAQYATEKIDEMDGNTPLNSLRRTVTEAQKVADGIQDQGDDVVKTLIEAIANLKDKLIPQLERVASQRREIDTLTKTVQAQESELVTLTNNYSNSEKLLADAIETADIARRKYEAAAEAKTKLSVELQRRKQEHTQEVTELKGTIFAHKTKETRQKKKIKEQEEIIAQLEQEMESIRAEQEQLREAKVLLERQVEQQDATIGELESQRSTYDESHYGDFQADEDNLMVLSSFGSDNPLDHGCSTTPSAPLTPLQPPRRPVFGSGWALPEKGSNKRKRTLEQASSDPVAKHFNKTLGLDRQGKVKIGVIAVGDRRKSKFVSDR
ncbi:hypothetical protein K474DRAFT_1773950 [Panus rudis PR-1116 ss-1]|nr:hypothetical protein K474DRAFT_1773950 [Panus rudis PR-1116 ss-1]